MTFDAFVARPGAKVLIEVSSTKGSVPREAGTFMLVSVDAIWGTIGGGNLEYAAIEHARDMLGGKSVPSTLEIALGPDSGQCCGGKVTLAFHSADKASVEVLRQRFADETSNYRDVYIFGAGHVGRALAVALRPLPFCTMVIETRQEELELLQEGIATRLAAMPEALVADIRPGGAAVILTHDHALDFLIGAEALKRNDLGYVGMIGSKTKRGVFANWLVRESFPPDAIDRLILPIGGSRLKDKRPEVIAALVAAELLLALG